MAKKAQDTAEASPTKQFFVSMLTRDIKLVDAILDLVDNCLDGAMRVSGSEDVIYKNYHVKIEFSEGQFSIEDNCGGIPRDVAKKYAFKMGREPDDNRDSETETIGMYGVGMKRAIFKMGRDALVKTRHGSDNFEVPISDDWLDDPSWEPLPIVNLKGKGKTLVEPGTVIRVKKLYDGISRHFQNASFMNDVKEAIGEHFTMFLQKGLRIEVNGSRVEPVYVEVLTTEEEDGPAPFIFQKYIEGVLVSITVGVNSNREAGEDDDYFGGGRSSTTAGWTVLCNDRAVIVGDKSRLTGWGDGIPLFHDQFNILTGIVEFRSADAERLPVTTTKRALDTSSDVWLESLVKMKEGMRVWTTYTNHWKNYPKDDKAVHWKDAKPVSLHEAIESVKTRKKTRSTTDGALEFNPNKAKVLPKPPSKKPSDRRITFSRPIEEVRLISQYFFDKEDEKPGVVGERCFELSLAKAKNNGKV